MARGLDDERFVDDEGGFREAGVQIAVLSDMVPNIRASGVDAPDVARIKGELRICDLIAKAVRDRQRRLRETAIIPLGVERLRVTPEDSAELISQARKRAKLCTRSARGRRPSKRSSGTVSQLIG